MAETVSFKVCLKNSGENSESDVRRFALDRSLSTNFATLSEKLSTILPCLHNKTFAVTWTDEDNDTITISTDDELTIAVSEMPGPVYKLNVQVTGEGKAAAGRNTGGDIHPGVMCDGCEKDLVGFRYKCLACPDFDLCGDCESAGLHPEHRMIRISKPGQKFSPKFGRNVRGNQRNPCQRPCHIPMTGHMAGNQGNSSHAPMPGFIGFLQGLEKVAGGHGNFGNCSKEEKPCNETKVGEKDVKNATENEERKYSPDEEVRKESEDKKGNNEKSPTEKMVTSFLEAAAGYLGDDVQVPSKDIENIGKLVSDIVSMFNVEVITDEQNKEPKDEVKEQEAPSKPRNDVEPEKQKSTNSNDDDEEWTILKDDSQVQVSSSNIYPTLDEVAVSSSSEADSLVSTTNTSPASGATPTSPDTTSVSPNTPSLPSAPAATTPCLSPAPAVTTSIQPSAPADVTDPKILVALQAMINMGFTNEGGWLQNLLEAKEGDIGKVLDVIKPNNK